MDPPAMMKHSVLRSGSSGNESYNLTEMCHFQCGQMLGQLMDNYPIGENSLMADQNGLRKRQQSHSKRLKTSKRSRDEDSVERRKHAEKSWKQIEAPKQDYIHVRARRGEATDSHSLAERARRKKISERMKILQELVPGCNKVIGKALVLDEIINYIHSLQQQVDFLSMKVEAVNSRLEPGTQEFPSNFSSRQTYNTGVLTFGFGSHALGEYGKGKGS